MTFQTFTPLEYLKIDVASNYGLDKSDWNDRLAWFDKNQDELADLVQSAEEPALFYAGVKAYQKAISGEPISYPVSLDATASGAQILALLIGCEKSAKLCNVLDAGYRGDLYTTLYKGMTDRIGSVSKIKRADTKQAIMTALYGSVAKPIQIFGEGELLSAFFTTMEEDATGIWLLNQALLNLWKPDALVNSWVLPDNYHVHVKVMDDAEETVHFLERPYTVYHKVNAPAEDGRSLGANITHSIDGMVVREMTRRCTFNTDVLINLIEALGTGSVSKSVTREKDRLIQTLWNHYLASGFLSARILDNLDEHNLGHVDPAVITQMIHTLPEKSFPILSIHDCFRVHPNYGNDLRKQYNQILYEIAKSNLLASVVSQINGQQTNVHKFADFSNEVLQANYALS
jgi:hypothetical protein